MSTSPLPAPTLVLNDGVVIPQLGLGVWQVPDDQAAQAVASALQAGYRSIDTASAYQNEAGVGEGIRASGLPREDVFVTTKLWNSDQGYDNTIAACRRSLERLRLDYVDLYLIHWPTPDRDLYVETWRAFIDVQAEGLVRSIGVSNFTSAHLTRLMDETGVTPSVNQVELHPQLQQADLRAFHARKGIATEAWSPLAQGRLMAEPSLVEIATRLGVSVAQVILRWHIQIGNIVIPKSVTPARIAENIALFDFSLTDDDMAAIAALDVGTRLGPHPDAFAWLG